LVVEFAGGSSGDAQKSTKLAFGLSAAPFGDIGWYRQSSLATTVCHFFCAEDRSVLLAIVRGENVITGFRHADLSHQLPRASTNQVSRYIKRLRVHGIIKRVARRYKYYITDLGRRVVLTGLKLREFFVIPHLNALPAPT
jgi:hypothetical protein